MQKTLLITLASLSYLHIIRDYMQLKYGYNYNLFTSFGHVWDAPQYETIGMFIFFTVGTVALYFAFR